MYPWTLHHRLLFAFTLPVALLLLSLALLISNHYRDDMLVSHEQRRELTLRNTAEALSLNTLSASEQSAWLQKILPADDLRRLSLLTGEGNLIADAGQSQSPLPSRTRLQRFKPGQHTLTLEDGHQDLISLPDGRWLVLTSTQQMLRLAFYERLSFYIALSLALLAVLGGLLYFLLRQALQPLNEFADKLDQPDAISSESHAAAKRLWPELVTSLTRYYFKQKQLLDLLKQDSEHAETELRETLDAIERQNITLHAARRSAQASNQLKSEFLANISHEIRTPLTSLLGFARLLERTPLSVAQQQHVGALSRSGEHLLAILNDLLDLSKIEAGRLILDETPVQLSSLLTDAAAMLAPLLGDKPVKLRVHCASDLTESLLGDPLRLRQIFTNLLSNAIKFTARGEINANLSEVSTDASRVQCQLTISDTGVGIDPDRLHSLFEAFEQADTSTSRHFGGTGLGLTITRQLVQLMGGHLGAASRVGQGSTFTVTWWAARDPFYRGSLQGAPRLSTALSSTQHITTDTSPLRVLIVDDHPANLQLMQAWLQELGIHTCTADNGEAAITAAAATIFDLIFMDIQMPIMNGLEAAQAIRAQERGGQRVPIIALTAHALNSEREFWLRNGIDDYLSKPLDESQLHHILQQWTRYIGQPISAIDWPEAERLAGGRRSLAEQLISTLIDDIPLAREQLVNANTALDAQAWQRAVHRLLGACRYTGVPALRAALEAALLLPNGSRDESLHQRILYEMDALMQSGASLGVAT